MKDSTKLLGLGALSAIGAVLTFTHPFAASLLIEELTGGLFLIVGILGIFATFGLQGPKFWSFLTSLLGVIIGISLIAHPLDGLLTLTALLAIVLVIGGVVALLASFSIRGKLGFWMMIIAGALSTALGVMIYADYPQGASTIIGQLTGLDFITLTLFFTALGVGTRHMED